MTTDVTGQSGNTAAEGVRPRLAVFALVALLVLLADQASKFWVIDQFVLHESRPVVEGVFHLTFVLNTGIAFGVLAGAPSSLRLAFFICLTIVALLVLFSLHRRLAAGSVLASYGLAGIAGGALGNLIDRLRLGAVIDFLDFFWKTYHWPAFNVADSAITVGTALVLWSTLGKKEG